MERGVSVEIDSKAAVAATESVNIQCRTFRGKCRSLVDLRVPQWTKKLRLSRETAAVGSPMRKRGVTILIRKKL